MSRAPGSAAQLDEAGDYLDAYEAVFRLHERGYSFSGRERNCVFLNTGGRRFADISAASGLDFADDGRGAAAVDWDQDGDLDLWLANRTAPQLRLLLNDSAGGEFLALRLEGRTGNRDAIGARVELRLSTAGGDPPPLVRTLRAGEGFLSQSSKWLHFGLGQGARIEAVEVHWPGGPRERFAGAEANRRYRLVEGSGRLEPWEPPSRRLRLAAAPLALPPPTTPPRVVLAARAPVPELIYRGFDGGERQLREPAGKPVLLNLWATWCLPCRGELTALTASAGEIRAAGLRVVALSVDGLDETRATSAASAAPFLDQLGFPFEGGLADPGLLSRLQVLLNRLFSLHLELAIPTSLLLDGSGRLAALYRGPVEVERLLGDVRNLGAPAVERRRLATPLPGRWLAPPQELRLTTLARRFVEEGLPADGISYLELAVAESPADWELRLKLADLLARQRRPNDAREHYSRAVALAPEQPRPLAGLADLLAGDGRAAEAAELYRRALAAGGDSARLRRNLGAVLLQLGREEQGLAELRRAVALAPDLAVARAALGSLLLARGALSEAVDQLRRALELDGRLADAHGDLGIALLHQDRVPAATDHLRRAVELAPGSARAHNNLGVALLRQGERAAAAELFRRALEIEPGYTDARDNLAAALRVTGEP